MGIVNAQWGFFAIPFIGRVGYQLSTFYRAQVRNKTIADDSFVIDPNGKMRQVKHKQKIEMTPDMNKQMLAETAELVSRYINFQAEIKEQQLAQQPQEKEEPEKQPSIPQSPHIP